MKGNTNGLNPKKKNGKLTFQDIQKFRINREQKYRKERKEKLLRTKRFKHLEDFNFDSTTDSGSESEFSQDDFNIISCNLYSKDREETLKALKTFSRSLTCTNNDYEEVIINKWSIQLLNLLQSTDEEIIYYSICCITNIAAGSSELVNSVVKTIPYLTLLLSNEAPKIKNQHGH